MSKKIKIELDYSKFEGLCKAGLITECKIIEVVATPVLDAYGEVLKRASVDAYKEFKEYEHKLKIEQKLLD